ncbi:MAG TPA: hypothetical protein VIL86_02000 [Tepidisphaeraceae bacterium]|jgi:hypothetical protein
MIRVILPQHLRTLANVGREVTVDVVGPVTQRSILDALEARYPMLRGTIREHDTQQRRKLVRFFACQDDVSQESPDAPLADAVASGAEPFYIIGAIAGGTGDRRGRRVSGDKNFISKAFCMFMNMDKMIGADFERGLAQMKAVAEADARR